MFFCKKKRIQNDWFDDQDEEIQHVLNDKNLNRHALRRELELELELEFYLTKINTLNTYTTRR